MISKAELARKADIFLSEGPIRIAEEDLIEGKRREHQNKNA